MIVTAIKENFRFSKNLFVDTFKLKGTFEAEKKQIQASLQTRAQIFHTLLTLNRVIQSLLGITAWQKAYRKKDEIESLSHDFY